MGSFCLIHHDSSSHCSSFLPAVTVTGSLAHVNRPAGQTRAGPWRTGRPGQMGPGRHRQAGLPDREWLKILREVEHSRVTAHREQQLNLVTAQAAA